jgi:outer membrane protein OmpA-like peptidoglycan-associated protein
MGRTDPTRLSLQSDEAPDPARGGGHGGLTTLLVAFLVALLAGLGFVGYEMVRRARRLEEEVARLSAETRDATLRSQQAINRALQAEAAARMAADGRHQAEAQTATAREQAEAAKSDATTARDEAARAQAEAERIRKRADAELTRLEGALGQVAETRRTALGLVMNLGSDYLKFEFDKADLRPQDRELLSRVAGILLTSHDYTVSVNGHTDDQGTEAYNQKLSERRAQAVRDYLVKAGLAPEILSVTGHGKSLPLVKGSSDEARSKNRRVELGIANTRIDYGRPPL